MGLTGRPQLLILAAMLLAALALAPSPPLQRSASGWNEGAAKGACAASAPMEQSKAAL
jgi:hypothetical protein